MTHLLREPLTSSVYVETALVRSSPYEEIVNIHLQTLFFTQPINSNSLDRIIPKIQAIGTVKNKYGEFGSFESYIFSSVHIPLKVMENVR